MKTSKEQKYLKSNSLIGSQATVLQRRVALGMSGLLIAILLLTLPFAFLMLPHIPAYIAIYSSLALFGDLITAYLFFGQFFRTRSPALLGLAVTYLYSSLLILPYMLSFPGVFSATGLLYAGTQTTNWLWIFWHSGFALGIVCSFLLEWKYGGRQAASRQTYRQFALVLALLPLLVLLLSFIAIESDRFLPIMVVNGNYSRLITSGVGPAVMVICVCAWLASVFQARRGTVIHTWLSVAVLASLVDVILTLWAGSRFSLGWYLARAYSIVTATAVLYVLLYQVNSLYESFVNQVQELLSIKEANRVRDQFLATMSHELRTPLASIIGFSEMLLDDAGTAGWDRQQQSNLERILANSEHLLDLINDVLDLSKMEAGRMVLNYKLVGVRDLLSSVTEETRSIAIKRNLFLRTEVQGGLDCLETNAAKLHQVLLNLVSNALKFTDHGGVTLSASRVVLPGKGGTEGIAFTVQDSGIGIPADLQERIFEAFYQADMSYTRKVGGTGLGLSIVRQLTALLGGTISVASAPGQGSTFTLTLPVRASHGLIEQGLPRLHAEQPQDPLTPPLSAPVLAPAPPPDARAGPGWRAAAAGPHDLILAVDDNAGRHRSHRKGLAGYALYRHRRAGPAPGDGTGAGEAPLCHHAGRHDAVSQWLATAPPVEGRPGHRCHSRRHADRALRTGSQAMC